MTLVGQQAPETAADEPAGWGRLRVSSDMPDIATTEKLTAGPEQVRYGQGCLGDHRYVSGEYVSGETY